MKKAVIILGAITLLAAVILVIELLFSHSYTTGRDSSNEISEEFSDLFDCTESLKFSKVFDYFDRYSTYKDCLYRAKMRRADFEKSFSGWERLPIDLSHTSGGCFNKRSKAFLNKFYENGYYKEITLSLEKKDKGDYVLAVYDSDEEELYYYKLFMIQRGLGIF